MSEKIRKRKLLMLKIKKYNSVINNINKIL